MSVFVSAAELNERIQAGQKQTVIAALWEPKAGKAWSKFQSEHIPTALYCDLLPESAVPEAVRAEARGYQYGRAAMQVHVALDAPLQWSDAALDGAPNVRAVMDLQARMESVHEGVLVSGTVSATATGACVRCLDEIDLPVEVGLDRAFGRGLFEARDFGLQGAQRLLHPDQQVRVAHRAGRGCLKAVAQAPERAARARISGGVDRQALG